MTSPGGDLTVRQAVASLVLRWDGDDLDWESERRAFIEVTDGTGELFLPRGPQGPPGESGAPGPSLTPDLVIDELTDARAMAALPPNLRQSERGFCVINQPTRTAFFWTGKAWVAVSEALGLKGEDGRPVSIGIGTVTTSAAGSSAAVTLDPSSTTLNRVINFTLPRGQTGPAGQPGVQGPPGNALLQAGDVDTTTAPATGQVLVWDATAKKARFTAPTSPSGPYAIGPNEIVAVNDSSWPQEYKAIGQVVIPAQPFAWRPRISGLVDVRVGANARVDVEARLNAATGPVVGRGAGTGLLGEVDAFVPRTVVQAFESKMTPADAAATVARGQEATIFFQLRRIDTLAVFSVATRKDRASLSVSCDPVAGTS